MNKITKKPWRILAVVLVIALTSMACSFSLGAPDNENFGLPQEPRQEREAQPTLRVLRPTEQGQPESTPQASTGEDGEG